MHARSERRLTAGLLIAAAIAGFTLSFMPVAVPVAYCGLSVGASLAGRSVRRLRGGWGRRRIGAEDRWRLARTAAGAGVELPAVAVDSVVADARVVRGPRGGRLECTTAALRTLDDAALMTLLVHAEARERHAHRSTRAAHGVILRASNRVRGYLVFAALWKAFSGPLGAFEPRIATAVRAATAIGGAVVATPYLAVFGVGVAAVTVRGALALRAERRAARQLAEAGLDPALLRVTLEQRGMVDSRALEQRLSRTPVVRALPPGVRRSGVRLVGAASAVRVRARTAIATRERRRLGGDGLTL